MTQRIPLTSSFLVELIHAIYFAMFNGFGTVAIQTLEDIHNRACFEMYTELILVTSAVRNSLHANPSGQPSDGPMGLSVALTPSTNTVTTAVSKSMITNASFRTKKLPDDIPIQVKDLTMPQAPPMTQHQLASLTEETAEQMQNAKEGKESGQQGSRNSIIRPSMETIKAHAQKALMGGLKKSKGKDKDKDKDPIESTSTAYQANGNTPSNSVDSNKPPQRKLDKHMQRNSLMQLQMESSSSEFEKSPGPVKGKTYESLDMEMLPMQSLLTNESGSGSFSVDSELNGGALVTGSSVSGGLCGGGGGIMGGGLTNNSNNNSTTTTTSLTSSDLLTTKSFDSSIELPPLSTTPGIVGVKANDSLVD